MAPRHVFSASEVAVAYPGKPLLAGLSFTLQPGLTLLCGGEGRGKTSLLRLIAGNLGVSAGTIQRTQATVFFETPADPAHDEVVARAWLDARRDARRDAGLRRTAPPPSDL